MSINYLCKKYLSLVYMSLQIHSNIFSNSHFTNTNQVLHLLVNIVSGLEMEETEAEVLNGPQKTTKGRGARAGIRVKELLRAKCRSGVCI